MTPLFRPAFAITLMMLSARFSPRLSLPPDRGYAMLAAGILFAY